MKKLIIFLLIIKTTFSYSQELKEEIKLPKQFKVVNSFSGELKDKESFHVVVARDIRVRDYKLIAFKYSKGFFSNLGVESFKKEPSILSFHSSNSLLTLVVSYNKTKRKQYIRVLDINTDSLKLKKSKEFLNKNSLANFRESHKTILLNGNKDSLYARIIHNSERIDLVKASDGYNLDLYQNFVDYSTFSTINQNEFVKNGSTSTKKAYYLNNSILVSKELREYTDDYHRSFHNETFSFNLDSKKLKRKDYYQTKLKKIKKDNSYVLDSLLVQVATNKKEGIITFFNTISKEKLNSIDLSKLNSNQIKTGSSFISISDFLKNVNRDKKELTITLNKTIEGHYLLLLDYVDITYNYSYNWWFHHNHMMMHQNMINSSIPNFGPNFTNYFHYIPFEEKRDYSLRFVIDSNGKLLNDVSYKTVFEQTDKQSYIKEVKDEKLLKYTSTCFFKDEFRYFAYNKKTKLFKAYNKIIND